LIGVKSGHGRRTNFAPGFSGSPIDERLAEVVKDAIPQDRISRIVGLGMSAIGRIGNSYSQNARDLPGYYLALDHQHLPVTRGIMLDADDQIRRAAINELMCHARLDMQAFGDRHGIRFVDYFLAELQRLRQLETDGLVEVGTHMLRVTSRGRLLLRNIAACLDAYLVDEATQANPPRYARSI
jgi:oxygen-independent coproporphyrinogen-3 oxidase